MYTGIILAVTISFLFAPKPLLSSEYCGKFFNLGKYAGFVINCDSYTYVKVSTQLSLLLEKNSLRQSRPLYPVMGAVMGNLLYPVAKYIDSNIYEVYFAGYVLLNFLFYLAVLFLMDTLLLQYTSLNTFTRAIFLIALISNPVTKTFFWTADNQFLVFFTPLSCIYSLQYLSNKTPDKIAIAVLSFVCGLSLLVYGNFILLAACVVIGLLYYRYGAADVLLSAFLICLPTILWIAILRANHVTYYNHEITAYHQFIWIYECINTSWVALQKQACVNYSNYMGTFGIMRFFIYITIILAFINMTYSQLDKSQLNLVSHALFLLAISILFFYLMGYYRERLTYTLFVPLEIIAAILYSRLWSKHQLICTITLSLSVLSFHVYLLLQYGPFM